MLCGASALDLAWGEWSQDCNIKLFKKHSCPGPCAPLVFPAELLRNLQHLVRPSSAQSCCRQEPYKKGMGTG